MEKKGHKDSEGKKIGTVLGGLGGQVVGEDRVVRVVRVVGAG